MARVKRVTQISNKGVGLLNEDAVLTKNKLGVFGVFDGASSLDNYLSPDNKTGAYLASNLALEVFSKPAKNLVESLEKADSNIDKIHRNLGIDTTYATNRFSTTVAVVRVQNNNAELLQVGDSIIIVIYVDGHVDVPLGYHDHDQELMLKWRKLADQGKTNIRQIVSDEVIQLRESGNVTFGTLNGDGCSKRFMKNMTLELNDVSDIIIVTDGMFVPKPDPDSREDWNYYAKLYKIGGLEKILQTVRRSEKTDPNLTRYPRYKLHDDASGVGIEFS